MLQKLSNFYRISGKQTPWTLPTFVINFHFFSLANIFFIVEILIRNFCMCFATDCGNFSFRVRKVDYQTPQKVDLSPSSVKLSAESNIFAGEVMGKTCSHSTASSGWHNALGSFVPVRQAFFWHLGRGFCFFLMTKAVPALLRQSKQEFLEFLRFGTGNLNFPPFLTLGKGILLFFDD
jgi:hypothetical protein